MQQAEVVVVAEPSFSRALLLGVLAGVAGGLVWYGLVSITDRHLSAVSMIVGLGVGQAIVWGGGRGRRYQALSVAITLAALLVTEAFAIRLLAVRELVELGVTEALPVFLPLMVMKDLVSAGLTADPPTALFWAVALWYAISAPRRRRSVDDQMGFTG